MIKKILFFLIVLIRTAHAFTCVEPTSENFITGKFEVADVTSASILCSDKTKKTIVPGCILRVKIVSDRNAPPKTLHVLGGPGSCDFKKGQILEQKLSNYCCSRIIAGCEKTVDSHSTMTWACSLQSQYKNLYYIFNADDINMHPGDRGFFQDETSESTDLKTKKNSWYNWFSEIFR